MVNKKQLNKLKIRYNEVCTIYIVCRCKCCLLPVSTKVSSILYDLNSKRESNNCLFEGSSMHNMNMSRTTKLSKFDIFKLTFSNLKLLLDSLSKYKIISQVNIIRHIAIHKIRSQNIESIVSK